MPTAAITLGRDEVKVSQIDSRTHRTLSPSEVINVWDTEVPIRDSREKVSNVTMELERITLT